MELFLKADQEEAGKELQCYNDCMYLAIEYMAQGKFKEASIEHENLARSLCELQRMKNAKKQNDQIIKEIKEQQDQQRMVDFWRRSV